MKMKNNFIEKTMIIIFACLMIYASFCMRNIEKTKLPIKIANAENSSENKAIDNNNGLKWNFDSIPEEYSNLEINMITNYSIPRTNIFPDLRYKSEESTIMAFWLTGIDNIDTVFNNLKIYEFDIEKDCFYQVFKDSQNVYVIAIYDGYIDFNSFFVSVELFDNSQKGKILNVIKEIGKSKPGEQQFIDIGDILYASEYNFWYRLSDNEEGNIDINENYIEYTKTLDFYSFGYYTNINVEEIYFITNIKKPYEINYNITENNKNSEDLLRNTTGKKQIEITLKVDINNVDENTKEEIIEDIKKSYISYYDQKISIN